MFHFNNKSNNKTLKSMLELIEDKDLEEDLFNELISNLVIEDSDILMTSTINVLSRYGLYEKGEDSLFEIKNDR